MNAGDYDYAIVLRSDPEYRQAVEALPNIADFHELSSTRFADQFDHVSFDSNDKFTMVSEQDFERRITSLQRHKVWANKEARRSTVGFLGKYSMSDEAVMSNFVNLLSHGIYLTRHRENNETELIKLYSLNNGEDIQWHTHNTPVAASEGDHHPLNDIHGSSGAVPADPAAPAPAASFSLASLTAWVAAVTRSEGRFHESDILRVHPAKYEDPTNPGAYGTAVLRSSMDSYDEDLTFSLVLQRPGQQERFTTLDLECESFDLYLVLLKGFVLIYDRARRSRLRELGGLLETSLFRYDAPTDFHIWKSLAPSPDPVGSLFARKEVFGVLYNNSGPNPAQGGNSGHAPTLPTIREQEENQQQELDNDVPTVQQDESLPRVFSMSRGDIPPAQFLGWRCKGTQIWARVKMAGLEARCQFSWDLSRVLLNIRCPQWRLEQVAEKVGLKLKTRQGALKKFRVSKRDMFRQDSRTACPLFRSSERQQIIVYLLNSCIKDGGAELDCDSELGCHIAQRFPLHRPRQLERLQHAWVTFWRREPFGTIPRPWSPLAVPLTYTAKQCWGALRHLYHNLLHQPLGDISDYFGETVAFYFAFLGFYTRWLLLPAAFGLAVFCVQMVTSQLDSGLCVIYTLVLMVWAAYMLVAWQREEAKLAFEWNVLGHEVEEVERPQFVGMRVHDDVYDEDRKVYPTWRRLLRYCVTTPILIGFTAIMVFGLFEMTIQQDDMYVQYIEDTQSSSGQTPSVGNFTFSVNDFMDQTFWTVAFFYPCLYSLLVDVMALVFNQLALVLNKYENHRTETTFTNRLILKVFGFRVVIVFISLVYYSFVANTREDAYLRVAVVMFSLMTVGQAWGIFLRVCVPYWYHRLSLFYVQYQVQSGKRRIYLVKEYLENRERAGASRVDEMGNLVYATRDLQSEEEGQYKQSFEAVDKREKYLNESLSPAWKQAMMLQYSVVSDYTTLFVQLGLILLFSPIFPLAPFIALLTNVMLIRFGAFKLCCSTQRPTAQKTGGIGVWDDILQLMSYAGIITDCVILGVTSDQVRDFFSGLSYLAIALLLFGLEHAVLLLKYILHAMLPKIPSRVMRAQARRNRASKDYRDEEAVLQGKGKKSHLRNTFVLNPHLNSRVSHMPHGTVVSPVRNPLGNNGAAAVAAGGGAEADPALPDSQPTTPRIVPHLNMSPAESPGGPMLGEDFGLPPMQSPMYRRTSRGEDWDKTQLLARMSTRHRWSEEKRSEDGVPEAEVLGPTVQGDRVYIIADNVHRLDSYRSGENSSSNNSSGVDVPTVVQPSAPDLPTIERAMRDSPTSQASSEYFNIDAMDLAEHLSVSSQARHAARVGFASDTHRTDMRKVSPARAPSVGSSDEDSDFEPSEDGCDLRGACININNCGPIKNGPNGRNSNVRNVELNVHVHMAGDGRRASITKRAVPDSPPRGSPSAPAQSVVVRSRESTDSALTNAVSSAPSVPEPSHFMRGAGEELLRRISRLGHRLPAATAANRPHASPPRSAPTPAAAPPPNTGYAANGHRRTPVLETPVPAATYVANQALEAQRARVRAALLEADRPLGAPSASSGHTVFSFLNESRPATDAASEAETQTAQLPLPYVCKTATGKPAVTRVVPTLSRVPQPKSSGRSPARAPVGVGFGGSSRRFDCPSPAIITVDTHRSLRSPTPTAATEPRFKSPGYRFGSKTATARNDNDSENTPPLTNTASYTTSSPLRRAQTPTVLPARLGNPYAAQARETDRGMKIVATTVKGPAKGRPARQPWKND